MVGAFDDGRVSVRSLLVGGRGGAARLRFLRRDADGFFEGMVYDR